jgi:hypothetical protein
MDPSSDQPSSPGSQSEYSGPFQPAEEELAMAAGPGQFIKRARGILWPLLVSGGEEVHTMQTRLVQRLLFERSEYTRGARNTRNTQNTQNTPPF